MKYSRVYIDTFGYELPPNVISSDDIEQRLEPLYLALRFQKGQLEVVGPFQKGTVKSSRSIKSVWDNYLYLVDLKEENRLRRDIIEELRQERLQLLEERAENMGFVSMEATVSLLDTSGSEQFASLSESIIVDLSR